ncbi:hypothetical protein SAMN05421505_110174 [Sinosporangium album]|uniref:CopG family transcriptional regulator n=1 Tax=Sinosporangium album TaxID=504805 RepID=A0A1G7Z3W2_9ACTN|nr:hypothetical protein [Sinosporangium album]SDH03186.1 hypothetical protein SAMN05421505_110174 [Sinosporangium album]
MANGTKKFSVTIPEDLAETVQARIGRASFSAYVSEALARQVEQDNLRDLIASAEAEHGPVDRAEVDAKRAILRGEAESTGYSRPPAA